MAANCPHCTKPIESLSGFVSQADLEARLKEKNTQIQTLTTQVTELTPKAQSFDTVNTALANAQRDLTTAREDFSLATKHGIKDPVTLAGLRAVHGVAMAALPEDKRVGLDGWLDGDGRQHPLVAPVLAAPAAPAAPATQAPATQQPAAPAAPAPAAAPVVAAPAAPAPNNLPNVNVNVVTPPTQQTKLTPAQLAEYFKSPAYLALPKEQRAAKRAELEGQYRDQPTAPAAA